MQRPPRILLNLILTLMRNPYEELFILPFRVTIVSSLVIISPFVSTRRESLTVQVCKVRRMKLS